MLKSPNTHDDVAHAMLDDLRSAREVPVGEASDFAIDAIETLGRLHARTEGGQLPPTVDGQDFPQMAARLFDDVREPVRIAVSTLAGRVDDARSHELRIALERRTALQYLKDDFRGTVADGFVDDDLFQENDGHLADKLREYGPFDFAVPCRVTFRTRIGGGHWRWGRSLRALRPCTTAISGQEEVGSSR